MMAYDVDTFSTFWWHSQTRKSVIVVLRDRSITLMSMIRLLVCRRSSTDGKERFFHAMNSWKISLLEHDAKWIFPSQHLKDNAFTRRLCDSWVVPVHAKELSKTMKLSIDGRRLRPCHIRDRPRELDPHVVYSAWWVSVPRTDIHALNISTKVIIQTKSYSMNRWSGKAYVVTATTGKGSPGAVGWLQRCASRCVE